MSLPWSHGAPKCVFISGGGSGIGREFAHRLAREGASVALFNRKLAPQVVAELEALRQNPDQRFASYSADVADSAALTEAIARAVAELGKPDLAINSAGIQDSKPFRDLSQADFERVVTVNLFGSRNFAAAVLPHLTRGDHLVFVASLAGLVGNFGYAAYCASKFGVRGLAEALRIELALEGIAVSLCCPGEIWTPLVEAERRTAHPISLQLKAFAGCNTLEPACDAMLRGIARHEFEIVDAFKPALTAFLARHLPKLMRRIGDGIARRTAARLERAGVQ